jgi:hypothetical protein
MSLNTLKKHLFLDLSESECREPSKKSYGRKTTFDGFSAFWSELCFSDPISTHTSASNSPLKLIVVWSYSNRNYSQLKPNAAAHFYDQIGSHAD